MKTMKLMLAMTIVAMCAAGCGNKKEESKTLVLYYSLTGNTKMVAEEMANRLGADIEADGGDEERGAPDRDRNEERDGAGGGTSERTGVPVGFQPGCQRPPPSPTPLGREPHQKDVGDR